MTQSLTPVEAGRSLLYVMGESIGRPPKRAPGAIGRGDSCGRGEWDWFYALPDDEQAYVRRNHMSAGGLQPDRFAAENGYQDVEECMARWVDAIRLTRRHTTVEFEQAWAVLDDERLEPGELVGPVELAELLQVKQDTVYQWVNRGRLPQPWAVVSGTRLWQRSTVLAWAEATGRVAEPEAF